MKRLTNSFQHCLSLLFVGIHISHQFRIKDKFKFLSMAMNISKDIRSNFLTEMLHFHLMRNLHHPFIVVQAIKSLNV